MGLMGMSTICGVVMAGKLLLAVLMEVMVPTGPNDASQPDG